ncbi:dioxygenase [Kytococcus sedentarius]|uniref:dioxygenase family protein n=1 Tax=Kytococcus sedentarius TaxID=1276 RepID=UPI0035BC7C74
MTATLPVLYLSHGAPPLADDATWTQQLADWSATIERPKNILMVSAHWESNPITVSSTTGAPLTYDFWGFPQKYYEVTYDAPAAPELAQSVARHLADLGPVHQDQQRGLDHGAYVPLVEMYPDADVPVLQVSLPTLDPRELFTVGQRLAGLREEGTLVVGSGFTTHNLRWFNPAAGADADAPTASREFDHWAAEQVAAGDVDALLDWQTKAPAALEAHPRSEHWAPLFVALGAASTTATPRGESAVDGFWYGLSKRSWTFA